MDADNEIKRMRHCLQSYVNGCKQDCDIFDFGNTYGVIDRGKGLQAKEMLKIEQLIDALLAMSPTAKVVKGELQNAAIDIINENPRRAILRHRSRDDASKYIATQVQKSPHIAPRFLFQRIVSGRTTSARTPSVRTTSGWTTLGRTTSEWITSG